MDKKAGYAGILKWSLAQHDPTEATPPRELSAEETSFLTNAMEEMMVDEVAVMKNYLVLISQKTVAPVDGVDDLELDGVTIAMKLKAFENLEILCENIDNAITLHLIGGYKLVIAYIYSGEDDRLKIAALRVIATCTQNNPKAQDAAYEAGALEGLMEGLADEDSDPKLRYAHLLCLSGLIRGHEASFNEFVKNEGLVKLKELLASEKAALKLKRKIIFMLSAFLIGAPEMKDTYREMDMLSSIASFISHEDVSISEHAIETVAELCVKNMANVEAFGEIAGVVEGVSAKLEELNALPKEEKDCASEIIVKCKVLIKRLGGKKKISISA